MPWPALIPLGHHLGKPAIPLMRPVMLIGSRHNAHLHLLSRQISKAHALLINSDGKVYIRDLASRTHVYVNGQEVREADLTDGDMLKLGSFTFRFQAAAGMKQKPAPDLTPPGQLEIDGGQFPLQIDERVMLIGRRPACDISLMEESCSTAHAVIFSMSGKRFVRDLGSRTGTLVNGVAVRQQEISFGDTVHIGDSDLQYQQSAESELGSTADELQDLVGTGPLISEAGHGESAEAEAPVPIDLDFDLGAVESDLGHSHAASVEHDAIPLAGDHDEALAISADADAEPQMLVGDNLMGEKLSNSATGNNMQAAAREAMEMAGTDETPRAEEPSPIEIAPAEVIAIEPAAEVSPEIESLEADLAIQPSHEEPVAVSSEDDFLREMELESTPVVEEAPVEVEAVAETPVVEEPTVIPVIESPEIVAFESEEELIEEKTHDVAPAAVNETVGVTSDDALVIEEPAPVAEADDELFAVGEVVESPIDETPLAVAEPAVVVHEIVPFVEEFAPVAEEPAAVEPEIEKPAVMESVVPEDLVFDVLPEGQTLAEREVEEPAIVFDASMPHSPVDTTVTTAADFDFAPAAPLELESELPAAIAESAPEPVNEVAETELFFGDETIEEIVHSDKHIVQDVTAQALPKHEPVEVIEATEPTVESALPLDEVAAPIVEEPFSVAEANLSDTTFGRQVTEFVAESPDPIVVEAEPVAIHEEPAVIAEAPAEIVEELEPVVEEPAAVAATSAEVEVEEPSLVEEPLAIHEEPAAIAEAKVEEFEPVAEERVEEPLPIHDEPAAVAEIPAEFEAEESQPLVEEPLAIEESPVIHAELEPIEEAPAEAVVEEPLLIVEEPAAEIEPQVESAIEEIPAVESVAVEEPTEPSSPGPLNFGVDADDDLVFDHVEEPQFVTTEITVLADLITTPDVVQDVTPTFTAVEPEPSPALEVEAPVEVEATPIDVAPELGADNVIDGDDFAPFEEAVELERAPEAAVEADPVALDELPLEEFPEEMPEATLENFELPTRSAIAEVPSVHHESEVTTNTSVYEPLPLIPGMPLNFAEPATLPDFVGGLPLVLNDLAPPPPTFGRVQVSFNGGVGPQSVVDEPITSLYSDEPGPFDNLQIDINNPVPNAPVVTHSTAMVEEPYAEELVFEETIGGEAVVAEAEPEIDESAFEELDEAETLDDPAIEDFAIEEGPPTAVEPEPSQPAPTERRGLFAKNLRVPPRPQREGESSGDGLGAAGNSFGFGGLTAASSAGNVDVFAQGFSADLSNDPIFGGAVKPMPKEPERKPRKKPEDDEPKFSKKSRRTLITPAAGDVEEMAGQLADDLGAPSLDELPPAPETIEEEAPAVAEPRAPRRAVSPRGAVQPVVPHEPSAAERLPRRRNGGRVALLLTLMFLLMIAASFFIYTFLKQNVHLSGTINYENFGKLTTAQQRNLQMSQRSLLVSEAARVVALNAFTREHPGSSAGYLGAPEEFGRNGSRVHWEMGTLIYNYDDGTDKVLDLSRVKATLDAVYKLDADMRLTAGRTRQQIEDMRANLDQKTHELADLEVRRKTAEERMSHEPAADRLSELRAEAKAAEEAFDSALVAAEQAGEAVRRLETASPTTLPSAAPTVAVSNTGDSQLDELTKSLEDMKARLSTARATISEQAEQARKQLDNAVEDLQKSTAAAEDLLKDNPELSAFVSEAQKTQQTVQKLAGDLLNRQEKSYEKLLENKNLLEEHAAQRRKELWDSDLKIKRMKDDLAMRERGYNAAKDQGYDKEADAIHKELESTLADVEKRKLELESDPTLVMLTDLLARCSQDINVTTRQLDADRKQADALTEQVQKSFAKLGPIVKNLPDSQRTLAQKMSTKMEAVTNARKQAAEAIVAKDNDRNPVLSELQNQIEAKTALVEERKKNVEAMNSQRLPAEEAKKRQDEVDRKRVAYAAAVQAKADAERTMLKTMKAVTQAESMQSDGKASRSEYDRLTQNAFNLRDKELPQLKQSLQQAEQNALTMAYPSEPKLGEVIAMEDRRLPYTALTVAGIALVFSLMIFFTGSHHHHPGHDGLGHPGVAGRTEEPTTGFGMMRAAKSNGERGGTSAAA